MYGGGREGSFADAFHLKGYLGVTLLLTETSDLVRLVINSMKKDLEDSNEINNCLALQAIANLGGREMAESLANDVFKILMSRWVVVVDALTAQVGAKSTPQLAATRKHSQRRRRRCACCGSTESIPT